LYENNQNVSWYKTRQMWSTSGKQERPGRKIESAQLRMDLHSSSKRNKIANNNFEINSNLPDLLQLRLQTPTAT
jgi:hypothetical protein